jgi:hypothetical protein
MVGYGCWRDNVFGERLWKSMKDEEVSWHAYDTISAAHHGRDRYLMFYNQTLSLHQQQHAEMGMRRRANAWMVWSQCIDAHTPR